VRRIIAASFLALALAACGSSGGGSQGAGGVTAAPRATGQAIPTDAAKTPGPSKTDMDDPYGYGY
jgi:hypothetical protein